MAPTLLFLAMQLETPRATRACWQADFGLAGGLEINASTLVRRLTTSAVSAVSAVLAGRAKNLNHD